MIPKGPAGQSGVARRDTTVPFSAKSRVEAAAVRVKGVPAASGLIRIRLIESSCRCPLEQHQLGAAVVPVVDARVEVLAPVLGPTAGPVHWLPLKASTSPGPGSTGHGVGLAGADVTRVTAGVGPRHLWLTMPGPLRSYWSIEGPGCRWRGRSCPTPYSGASRTSPRRRHARDRYAGHVGGRYEPDPLDYRALLAGRVGQHRDVVGGAVGEQSGESK